MGGGSESHQSLSINHWGFSWILKVNGRGTVNHHQSPSIHQWGTTTAVIVPLGIISQWN